MCRRHITPQTTCVGPNVFYCLCLQRFLTSSKIKHERCDGQGDRVRSKFIDEVSIYCFANLMAYQAISSVAVEFLAAAETNTVNNFETVASQIIASSNVSTLPVALAKMGARHTFRSFFHTLLLKPLL